MFTRRLLPTVITAILFSFASHAIAQHPPVAPGPGGEPNWADLLKDRWGLDLDRDLRNPVHPNAPAAGFFRRADPNKPVTFKPLLALGLETTTRGGWMRSSRDMKELWQYTFKPSKEELASDVIPSPSMDGATFTFDPGDEIHFLLWVRNDEFKHEIVTSSDLVNHRTIARFKDQPYKAMIYPNIDPKTKQMIPNSYIIGWEYSTNDDFQDVVTQVDNVQLVAAVWIPGLTTRDQLVRKLASGFIFTEGPAWNARDKAVYFTDIPNEHIIRYANARTEVAYDKTQKANGLMFDKEGRLVACEHGGRRVSRRAPEVEIETAADTFESKKLNSPNDLQIDELGGVYFTDPRYGPRDNMEMDVEGVYYLDTKGKVIRIVSDFTRPNGIALSPDGKSLYVLDNGRDAAWRYEVTAPGKIKNGQQIAHVLGPDGMAVDREGRLYITTDEGVAILDADGRWLGEIDVLERPSNCTFGGEKFDTLFITARKSLYAITTQTQGYSIHLDGPLKPVKNE